MSVFGKVLSAGESQASGIAVQQFSATLSAVVSHVIGCLCPNTFGNCIK